MIYNPPASLSPVIEMDIANFSKPDEIRTFEKGRLELVNINGRLVGKGTFQPGWKWSKHVKPIVKTASCEAPHLQYQLSGKMHVVMDDGREAESKAGDVVSLESGHDAWVVGNEPVVVVDFQGMTEYARAG
jgi:hypothetical protein